MTQPQVIIERPPPPKPDELKASYGFVTALVRSVPEIGSLLHRALKGQWPADRFQKELANTKWWKTTPAPQREWLVQKAADPATANQEMKVGGSELISITKQLGIGSMSQSRAQEMWLYAKMNGYTDEMIPAFVARTVRRELGTVGVGGRFGETVLKMQQMASAYGYNGPTAQQDIEDTVWDNLVNGRMDDVTEWQKRMVNYASTKYTAFADQFKAGLTVQDVARPYVDVMAETLELNPHDISLEDQYVQKWLQGRDTQGAPPPVWQAAQQLRQDPRWATTKNAMNAGAQMIREFGERMGFYG